MISALVYKKSVMNERLCTVGLILIFPSRQLTAVVLAALLLLRGRHKAISKIKRRPYRHRAEPWDSAGGWRDFPRNFALCLLFFARLTKTVTTSLSWEDGTRINMDVQDKKAGRYKGLDNQKRNWAEGVAHPPTRLVAQS